MSFGAITGASSTGSLPALEEPHASIQTTFDLYGHLMPGNEDEAVTLVDAYLERAATGTRLTQLG